MRGVLSPAEALLTSKPPTTIGLQLGIPLEGSVLEEAIEDLPPGTVISKEVVRAVAARLIRNFDRANFDVDRPLVPEVPTGARIAPVEHEVTPRCLPTPWQDAR
jgi:hypothetical protein